LHQNLQHYHPGDPDGDSNSRNGTGDHQNHLISNYSAALKKSDAQRWHIQKGQEFLYHGKKYRYDDTVPESDPGSRVDIYKGASRGDVHVHLNVHVLDSSDFGQHAMDNAHHIARAVKREIDSSFSRSATAVIA
jgi:hypothetical protein